MIKIYDKLHKETHHINTAGIYNQTMLCEYKYICVDNTNNDVYDVTINVAHRKKTRKTIIWLLKQFKEIRTINVLPW